MIGEGYIAYYGGAPHNPTTIKTISTILPSLPATIDAIPRDLGKALGSKALGKVFEIRHDDIGIWIKYKIDYKKVYSFFNTLDDLYLIFTGYVTFDTISIINRFSILCVYDLSLVYLGIPLCEQQVFSSEWEYTILTEKI